MATHYTCDRCSEPAPYGPGAHTRGPVELADWPGAHGQTRELYLQASVAGSERDFGEPAIDLCPNCIADALEEAAARMRTR